MCIHIVENIQKKCVNLPSINVRNIFVQRLDIEIFQSKLVQQQEDMRPLFAISVIEKGKL